MCPKLDLLIHIHKSQSIDFMNNKLDLKKIPKSAPILEQTHTTSPKSEI